MNYTFHKERFGDQKYFVSDLSHAVTGEIHYVDCGFNILGMPQN